ncbi:serine hydrolase domain-containing protein [Streptomyces goshikiensis]|uniref:serine hydrolase domain-containing protein n=1 Tax=Streptomyces goshikiensis TaxID=1942 RepID=UPI00371863E9
MSVTATDQDRPELRKAIEEIVDSGFTGVQLRVHDERGEWVAAAGVRELGGTAKPPENGRVRIGSNTKTFTAALVLRLVAEGRLALDDPAADFLPRFEPDRRITLRMLLQHTSGIFNFTGEYDEDGTFVPGIAWSGREWVDNRFTTYRPEELVHLALSHPARFEPGTDWSYSNTNYVLARLVIEQATGRTYAQEMERLVLRPLGLNDTLVPETATEVPEPHAHAYYRYEEAGRTTTVDVTRQNPSWISTGGDMISTTQDLHTFISALVTGKLLPAPLLAEMCAPHPKAGYGLGVFVQDAGPNGGTVITHNGGIAGHGALMYSTPDGSKTLTAALNYVDDAGLSLAPAFQKATQRLVKEFFGGQEAAGRADEPEPAQ